MIKMGFKTVSLSDEAYNALKKRKHKGESFNDLILRLVAKPEQKSILSLSGSWKGSEKETNDILNVIYKNRKNKGISRVNM